MAFAGVTTLTDGDMPYTMTTGNDGFLLLFNLTVAGVVNCPDTVVKGTELVCAQIGDGQVTFATTGSASFKNAIVPETRSVNAYVAVALEDDGVFMFNGKMGSDKVLVTSNYAASTAPLVTDDDSLGYTIGSAWFNNVTQLVYDCVDASTGVAVWAQRFAVDPELIAGADTTGILTGGEVTINADPTLVDIAAGTGVVIDWINPTTPTRTYVSFGPFIGEAIPNLATGQFTTLQVDVNGTLIKTSGYIPVPEDYRKYLHLQSPVHQSGVQVDSISGGSNPAYEVVAALYDYIRFLGPLNRGNTHSANGVNLNINKTSGETALPFTNRAVNLQSPSIVNNVGQTPVPDFVYTYRDGASGYTFDTPVSVIDPSNWDDNSGTPAAVSANQWTIQYMFIFGSVNRTTVVYGQEEYGSQAIAEAAVTTAFYDFSPLLNSGVKVTALVVKTGTTDLSDPAQASFLSVAHFHS